ncbi:MAG: hypothetical protein IPN33_18950 [Saprospiraceae bacterium]|nr:hypothetical protein [Saprospiraceae bacterium]
MKPATFLPLSICLAFFLAATQYVVAQGYMPDTSFWETKASMSQIRTYFPSVVASGRIYAFGGIVANAGGIFTYTDKIEKYDPDSDVVCRRYPATTHERNGRSGIGRSGLYYRWSNRSIRLYCKLQGIPVLAGNRIF